MLHFEMKPDPAFEEIVSTALDIEADLLCEEDDMMQFYPEQLSGAFNATELQREIERILEAHNSSRLYDLSQYHWMILYHIIEGAIEKHNDGSEIFAELQIEEIDPDALSDIYFRDLDFLIPKDIIVNMSMEKKEKMKLAPETFGVICGLKPHPDELKITAIEMPEGWESPDIYRKGKNYPYLPDEEE